MLVYRGEGVKLLCIYSSVDFATLFSQNYSPQLGGSYGYLGSRKRKYGVNCVLKK